MSWKLLERVIKDVFSLTLEKEFISVDSYGKPFIENRNNIHFNLSHSGEIVCCIVDAFPVGIDVEAVSPIDLDTTNFFHSKERFDLSTLPTNEQIKYFYKLWVLKESYIKAEGKGLSIPLNTFSFEINNDLIHFEGNNNHKWDFSLHAIDINRQPYQLGICTHKGRLPNKIIEIPYMFL